MTTTAPRLGERPTTAERVDLLEHQLAEALARIEALESARDADDQVDGPVPQTLPPNWVPIKKAAARVGRSESALLKAIKRHPDGVRWWRYDRGRLFADIDRLPWPQVRTRT
jgi:hypothetical protein